eukprot:7475496-Pyramimonas_sp.AAC.1
MSSPERRAPPRGPPGRIRLAAVACRCHPGQGYPALVELRLAMDLRWCECPCGAPPLLLAPNAPLPRYFQC